MSASIDQLKILFKKACQDRNQSHSSDEGNDGEGVRKIPVEKNGFLSFTAFDHFDDHWNEHFNPIIPEPKLAEAARFLAPLRDLSEHEAPVAILDVGCGDGVHIPEINNIGLDKGLKVGIDISTSALKSAQMRDSEKEWQFLHVDAGDLPFREETFDVCYSYGVIAYTTDPYTSLQEMYRVTKSGGLIGLWIYPKQKGIAGWAFGSIRTLCRIGGRPITSLIANAIVPFLGILPTSSGLNLRNASWKACKEVVMVNIAPTNLWFPAKEEIEQWFSKNNMSIVLNDNSLPITIWGRKL